MWFNPIMIWLLRSPLHGVISGSVMLVNYAGKRSGKAFSIPVNYLPISDQLLTISLIGRTWWRNFREPTEVNLRLRGTVVSAMAQAVEDHPDVSELLAKIVRSNPSYGRYLKISTSADGKPDAGEIEQAAQGRVAVVFRIIK